MVSGEGGGGGRDKDMVVNGEGGRRERGTRIWWSTGKVEGGREGGTRI